jgi:hypothetical protein
LGIVLVAVAHGDQEGFVKRTFRIDLSARDTMKMQDWSGKTEIDKGNIVAVEKTSGQVDTIFGDRSWTIIYGRSLPSEPKRQPNAKALLISVDAPLDAVLSVSTKGGEFSFRLDEIPAGKQVERLGGNALISIGGRPQPGRRQRGQALAPAKTAGELPAKRLSAGTRQSEWPAVSVAADGTTWCAFVEWNGKDRDRVLVIRRPPGGDWSAPVCVDDGGLDHYWPAVAAIGDGALVVWSSQDDGNFDLYWSIVKNDGSILPPERLTDSPHTDFHARMVGDGMGSEGVGSNGAGSATLVWQSSRDGQADVYLRRFTDGAWQDEHRVSPSSANDWQPDLAISSDGTVWISWDSYEHGNYDVFVRRFDQNGLGPVIPVTTETTAQFHSTVAVDRLGRVWVAWDEGGENWGKDLSTSSAAEGNRGLHYARTLGLRVVVDGKVSNPDKHPGAAFTGMMRRYAELPQLAVDGEGTLWLVFRHWSIHRPTEMFQEYATRLDADGWATPWLLGNSSGRNSQWTSIARQSDGSLLAAYASDGRAPDKLPTDQVHALTYSVYATTLKAGTGMPDVQLSPAELPAAKGRFVRRTRPTMTVGDKTYTLVMGDCHRHTDIRGHSGVDASIMDTFRYALDAAQLDYMGLGDHNEVFGGRWPDGLRDYQWWWSQKAVDLFSCPPVFVGIYSYEHSMSRPGGHRNILFLKRGAPLRMIDRGAKESPNPGNLPPELWKWIREEVLSEPGQKCVIVPHTFASGPLADWNWPNADFDCLLEIYQGCRGSYEQWGLPPGEKRGKTQTNEKGHFAQDALARGNTYGFVTYTK